MTNTAIANLTMGATAGATILYFPVRANEGGWDKLFELGAKLTEQDADGAVLTDDGKINVARSPFRFARCQVPAGWEIRASGVSLYQNRLYDGEGKMIAKIFYKPAGGCGSIHVFLTDDDPMAAPDVIPAFTQERTAPAPFVCDGTCSLALARRINDGGRERLVELGVQFVGQRDYQYNDVIIPAGWQFRYTDNVFVQQLFDAAGNHVAQLFFRPTGGTPSVHVIMNADDAKACA
ncbi:MAG: hypothetical protein IT342_12475 [Candidatus Melainabacteria bacterium]|nr:hypothetical protein [Candidatus Melainabacteria bacterium]